MNANLTFPKQAAAALSEVTFPAFGTHCLLRHAVPATPGAGEAFARAAREWIVRFEERYSRFRPDSIVGRINAAAGSWVEIDRETEQMLDICGALHRMTCGILDATAGPLLHLWDFRRRPAVLPDEASLARARRLVGWPLVERRPGAVRLPHEGMSLDFGGWGKEWAVDAVAEIARQCGVTDCLIDFGHDIRGLGSPPGRPAWHVGLEDPGRPGHYRGTVALPGGGGIASSGDYLRCFEHAGKRYGHIVDARTGRPVDNGVIQVTVIARTCFEAGVLSTTAFILGPNEGLEFVAGHPGAEALMLTREGRRQTRGFWHHVVS